MKFFFVILISASVLTGCHRRSQIAREYAGEVTTFAKAPNTELPYFVGKDLRPEWDPARLASPRSLSPFRLTDQMDRAVSQEDLRGKINVVSFFFSRCGGICPRLMKNLERVQTKFMSDDRVKMLSFSITPDSDTPKALREFGKRHGIDPKRWQLLTGDRKAVYELGRQSFNADTFSPKENELAKVTADDFLHSENVYLVDANLRLRGIYGAGLPAGIDELISGMEKLKR